MCFQIDFNLQREKRKSHSEYFSRDAFLYLLDKTSGLYSEKQGERKDYGADSEGNALFAEF